MGFWEVIILISASIVVIGLETLRIYFETKEEENSKDDLASVQRKGKHTNS